MHSFLRVTVLSFLLASQLPGVSRAEGDDPWFKQRFEEMDRRKRETRTRPSEWSLSRIRDWFRRPAARAPAREGSSDCVECQTRRQRERAQENLGPIAELSEALNAGLQPAAPAGGAWQTLRASAAVRDWFYSDNTRSRGYRKELLPQKNGAGDYRVTVCAGAGCPMKIPFTFSAAQLREIRLIGDRQRRNQGCSADTFRCELMAAQEMARQMEKLVVEQKLRRMSFEEMQKAYGDNVPFGGSFERNKQLDLDCVDQSANGSSYLLVLKDLGLLRHAEVQKPGYMLPSHWFTKLQADDGGQYRVDFYHRGRHAILPGVVKL